MNAQQIDKLTIDERQALIEKTFAELCAVQTMIDNLPKCAGCPNPNNDKITMGYAAGNEVWLCISCKREAEED